MRTDKAQRRLDEETKRLLEDARGWLQCITLPEDAEKARFELDILIIEMRQHMETLGYGAQSDGSECGGTMAE